MPDTDPHNTPSGGAGGPLSPEAFAAFFQESGAVLWTVAAGVLGERSEVEDVLQEAAVAALAKLDQFETGTNLLAWTATFVRNVALNHARKRVRRATQSAANSRLDEGPDATSDPLAMNGVRPGERFPSTPMAPCTSIKRPSTIS